MNNQTTMAEYLGRIDALLMLITDKDFPLTDKDKQVIRRNLLSIRQTILQRFYNPSPSPISQNKVLR